MSSAVRHVAVLGGGISGLAAAFRLQELAPQFRITLYEAGPRVGGILETIRRDDCVIERSADMFTTRQPWAVDLCRRIGLADQLIETNSKCRQAHIVARGKLEPVPEGFTLMGPARIGPLLRSRLLSWSCKIRLAAEYFVRRRRTTDDESLRDFAIRRFGSEAYERLIQPLIGGIYTADPTKLSMAATMPQFVAMEREHGSLIRGMRASVRESRQGQAASGTRSLDVDLQASGARYGLFVAPRDGMSSLIDAIASRLTSTEVRVNSPVDSLRSTASGTWQVTSGGGTTEFDGVIVALPAPRAASIVAGFDESLARQLAAIEYAGAAVVVGVFRQDQFVRMVRGFGFVAPIVEQRKILSASFASIKFAGRAPDGLIIVRVFIGGACQPELLRLADRDLENLAWDELSDLVGLEGAPLWSDVVRWDAKMPQYHVGHVERVAAIEAQAARHAGLALAGNAYHGVGIPFCVHSGEQAAESVLKQLTADRPQIADGQGKG